MLRVKPKICTVTFWHSVKVRSMWSSEVPNVSDVTWQNKLEWLERCYNTRTLYTHERWKKFTQMKKKSHNKQHLRTVLLDPIMGVMKLSEWVSVVLFIMLYAVVVTFESMDEILKCYHSNESYWAVLSCGAVCYAVQGGSNFWDHFFGPSISLIVLKVANKFLKMKMWPSHCCNHNLSSCKLSPIKDFWDFNGIRTHGLCIYTAVLYQLSYAVWRHIHWEQANLLASLVVKGMKYRLKMWTAEIQMKCRCDHTIISFVLPQFTSFSF